MSTNYKKLKRISDEEQIIRWVNVDGQAEKPSNNKSLINRLESSKIIEELSRLKNNDYEGSIGIVTPFRAQANLIQEELHQSENLYHWFINLRNGSINTVHLFQGDEKDIMFFSTVITDGINPNVMNFFKPNLFNVAITRARAGLVVFGKQEDCINSNHQNLVNLANYINNKEDRNRRYSENEHPEFKGRYPYEYVDSLNVNYSEWEVILYEELYKKGFRTIPQFSVDQYRLDLALFDELSNRKLNIEVDGVKYHADSRGELIVEDRIRNLKMIERGWDVKRFWVHEIRDNLDFCVNEIRNWIYKAD